MANALVTGAARGIGKAIALKLAQNQFNLVLNDYQDNDDLQTVAKECQAFGVEVICACGDVSDSQAVKQVVEAASAKFGSLDVLVNNAGITRDGLLMRMTDAQFDAVISTNLKGSFNFIRQVAPMMTKSRRGSIINITSISGINGNAGQANYAAAKAGIIGLTKTAAKELGSRGIRVNAVAPGFINTDMTKELPEEIKKGATERIALKRLGEAADIANCVGFLACEDSCYITGQVLVVDGGLSL